MGTLIIKIENKINYLEDQLIKIAEGRERRKDDVNMIKFYDRIKSRIVIQINTLSWVLNENRKEI